ncbi:MAG: tetratricopeptide repeat protein [Deltaproteobacteria bacterium]|nr:tetratricopeptide repeat protein [Deltaproteobacteria bacterium]
MTSSQRWLILVCALLASAAVACGGSAPLGTTPGADPGPLTDEPFAPADAAKAEIAMRELNAGNLDQAIGIFTGLRKRYPHHHLIVHELGLAYRIQGKPQKAVELLRPYEKYLDDQMAAALGSALDEAGDPAGAIETLKRALERFPDSGLLYSEIGTVISLAGQHELALEYWEKGIEAEPAWPSNYLRAAEIYSHSNARGLALIYGEVFRNLEPGSKRSNELAVLMVQTMRDAVEMEQRSGDQAKGTINLAPPMTIVISGPMKDGKNPIFAGMPLVNAFELAYGAFLFTVPGNELSLASLHEIKTAFLDMWWNPEGMHEYHDVRLFEWLLEIRDAGHLEAYDYWLYGPAFPHEFDVWRDSRQAELAALLHWLDDHPLYEPAYDNMYPAGG